MRARLRGVIKIAQRIYNIVDYIVDHIVSLEEKILRTTVIKYLSENERSKAWLSSKMAVAPTTVARYLDGSISMSAERKSQLITVLGNDFQKEYKAAQLELEKSGTDNSSIAV